MLSDREWTKLENISIKMTYCLEGESLIYCITSSDPSGAGISANPGCLGVAIILGAGVKYLLLQMELGPSTTLGFQMSTNDPDVNVEVMGNVQVKPNGPLNR